VYAVVKRYRERGDIENRPRSGRKKKLDDRDTRKLLRLVKNNRSLPLQDITRKLMKIGKYLAILKFPNFLVLFIKSPNISTHIIIKTTQNLHLTFNILLCFLWP
jgi:hypothetical protein